MKALACLLLLAVGCATSSSPSEKGVAGEKRLLYVASPGIRNYLEWGGTGVLVYDIDDGHKFLKRIPVSYLDEQDPAGKAPENVKGICASAKNKRLYVSTLTRLGCIDLVSEKLLWVKRYPDGCDRMSITPDGKKIYLPTLEKDDWHVVDAATGDVLTKISPKSGAHNTVMGLDGSRVYLAGLKSPLLRVTDTSKHEISTEVGPFGSAIRPFTVN